jgi:hypothetical protein
MTIRRELRWARDAVEKRQTGISAEAATAVEPPPRGGTLPRRLGTIKAYGAMAGFAVDWQLSGFHVS